VVEILETVQATPQIVEACRKLKEAGYTLALDDFVGQPGFEEILKIADIVKVEVLGQPTSNIIKISQALKKGGTKLLAEKVEDAKTYQLTKSLGYEYFQGYFFSRPEIIPGRKISANQISKMRLLQALSREDVETKELAKIIEGDLSLSYRILRFMNSAAFGLAKTLTSVEQAVALLGRRPLKQWIMVVSLSDLAPTPRAEEISFQSIQRGRYLETLVASMPSPVMSKDTAFLLGLFSKLDALFNQPMEEILGDLPLETTSSPPWWAAEPGPAAPGLPGCGGGRGLGPDRRGPDLLRRAAGGRRSALRQVHLLDPEDPGPVQDRGPGRLGKALPLDPRERPGASPATEERPRNLSFRRPSRAAGIPACCASVSEMRLVPSPSTVGSFRPRVLFRAVHSDA
jgi:EAL and modified HD-GYP domain-containing signal transduction protein